MGSGEKFRWWWCHDGYALSIHISDFPHRVAISITLLKLGLYFGFGKGYDE